MKTGCSGGLTRCIKKGINLLSYRYLEGEIDAEPCSPADSRLATRPRIEPGLGCTDSRYPAPRDGFSDPSQKNRTFRIPQLSSPSDSQGQHRDFCRDRRSRLKDPIPSGSGRPRRRPDPRHFPHGSSLPVRPIPSGFSGRRGRQFTGSHRRFTSLQRATSGSRNGSPENSLFSRSTRFRLGLPGPRNER